MDKWLNRLANIALITMAVVGTYVAVVRPSAVHPATESYQVGERLNLPISAVGKRTAVIATRSSCGYCTQSLPFYRSIAGVDIVWVAIGEDVEANRTYLKQNGITPTTVLDVTESNLTKITSTPTMLLIDNSQTVLGVWTGKLTREAELAALATLKGVTE